MTWTATSRYGLYPAPGFLGFVHNLLNTEPAGRPRRPDLLADLASAQEWADAATGEWAALAGTAAPTVVLGEPDLVAVRNLRADLHTVVAGHTAHASALPVLAPVHRAGATVELGSDGRIRLEPRGSGWRAMASLALIAITHAQAEGTWPRLKACRNPRCQAAFYDRSRNNSAVWHDVRACGNPANLRAHRARQRDGHRP
ncbi:CGNR zinc finger domain-containing protein [Amycolatopsis sp. PS_44_ISF1]|uniref:CGNR zinc finger domain-containing protein n=1 Tax=Amycolatopsis sp. PS_44_ISF1 TaxID=2974917 RepID=UPI0028E03321|nr:CGNR zinc finger domain-containing protein [Amycolatopsis sp. PS_44_ISF1]MDT8913628.1 CGNR zinc finger domain-containing protein [Amycolatopsis sp. PS_44_ISF1]